MSITIGPHRKQWSGDIVLEMRKLRADCPHAHLSVGWDDGMICEECAAIYVEAVANRVQLLGAAAVSELRRGTNPEKI